MLDCGVSSPTWLAIIWSMLIERWFGWGLSYLDCTPKLHGGSFVPEKSVPEKSFCFRSSSLGCHASQRSQEGDQVV
jgi:hypothetical protein